MTLGAPKTAQNCLRRWKELRKFRPSVHAGNKRQQTADGFWDAGAWRSILLLPNLRYGIGEYLNAIQNIGICKASFQNGLRPRILKIRHAKR